jgi:hypothetical protein
VPERVEILFERSFERSFAKALPSIGAVVRDDTIIAELMVNTNDQYN